MSKPDPTTYPDEYYMHISWFKSDGRPFTYRRYFEYFKKDYTFGFVRWSCSRVEIE